MPQSGDRNMTSKEANEKIAHFQAEGGEKPMIYDYLYSSFRKIFAIAWPLFSLTQVKFLKKPEVMRKK